MDKSISVFHRQPLPKHGLVRTFSKEVHGNNYKAIAKEYVDGHANDIVKVEGLDEPTEKSIKKTRKVKK